MNLEWVQFLFDTFKLHHKAPGWETIKNQHDSQDQEFFTLLEETI